MGGVFHIFADCREARRRLEGRVVALERTSARFGAKREVTEREVVERQKKDWNCAFSTGWAGLAGRGRAIFAKSFSGSGHHTNGALGVPEKAAGQLYSEKAVGAGARPLRTDWAAFANRDIDGAPEACPGGRAFS